MSVTILGIESSCDDTSSSVIRDGVMLSNVIASQAVHEAYGGVVPENADLAVLTRTPDWECEYTTFSTGGNVSQKLWIVCRMDKTEAVALYDFIIQQLLS